MTEVSNQSIVSRASKWFDPRAHSINMIGFILNRITALGLTLYLFIHLIVLHQLADGAAAYNNFIALAHSPIFIFLEVLVVTAGFMHGLNGIRIALNSFGVGIRSQKLLFVSLFAIAIIVSLAFAVHMFTA
jgi:succinate dehydrogenase / fumarate reductase, cytochrome b subunit